MVAVFGAMMRTRQLGNTDLHASIVGLGTWAIGGGSWWGKHDDNQSIAAIHAALDAGINFIDTAPVYGFGHSETLVGQALKDRRDQVILATKAGLWWDDARGSYFFSLDGYQVYRTLRPETLTLEIERSLRRLNTDHIDLYQTHWQSTAEDPVLISDTMECLLRLREQGKIRAIGASNTTLAQLEEYLAAGELVTVQEHYSMLNRHLEQDFLPFCRTENISVLAYSPLEQGLLTGTIGVDVQLDPASYRSHLPWFAANNRERVLDMLAGWDDLCEEYACSLAQLVIAWTAQQSAISVVLCGARRVRHAEDNAHAAQLSLKTMDIERMRQDVENLGIAESID